MTNKPFTNDEWNKLLDYSVGDLDENVINCKCQEASDINNEGVMAQIRYLSAECGTDWVRKTLFDKED